MENTELKHLLIAYKSNNIGLQQAHDEIMALFEFANNKSTTIHYSEYHQDIMKDHLNDNGGC